MRHFTLIVPTLGLMLAACGDEKSPSGGIYGTTSDPVETDDGDSGDAGETGTTDSGDSGETGTTDPVDVDGDGATSDVDCDDNNSAVFPGAEEWVDGVDNDCDAATTEDGQVTWFGSAGPVDVTADIAAEWTAPEDGRLAFGPGTYAPNLSVPAGLSVDIEGIDSPTFSAGGNRVVYVEGTASLTGITVDEGTVDGGLDADISLTDMDFVAASVSVYQGSDVVVTGCTFAGASRALQGVNLGGADDAPRTITVSDSTVVAGYSAIPGFDEIAVTGSTIEAETSTLTGYRTLVVTDSVLRSEANALAVGVYGGGQVQDAVVTGSTIEGYNTLAVYPDGTLTVEDSTVTASGTGLSVFEASATLQDVELSTTANVLVTVDGRTAPADLTLIGVALSGAQQRHLVGIYDTTVTMEDCTLSGASLGSVKLDTTASGTSAFRRNTFTANTDTHTGSGWYGNGGALALSGSNHTHVLEDNVFDSNSAAKDGGAVYLLDTTATLSGNTFTTNAASSGGALYVAGDVTFSSSGDTFTDNVASLAGGAVRNGGQAVTFTDPVMLRNSASVGGAVSGGPLTLSGDWDFGTGADDNTPDDYQYSCGGGSTYTIDSGSGAQSWRGSTCNGVGVRRADFGLARRRVSAPTPGARGPTAPQARPSRPRARTRPCAGCRSLRRRSPARTPPPRR